jgi:hypothetical protein
MGWVVCVVHLFSECDEAPNLQLEGYEVGCFCHSGTSSLGDSEWIVE